MKPTSKLIFIDNGILNFLVKDGDSKTKSIYNNSLSKNKIDIFSYEHVVTPALVIELIGVHINHLPKFTIPNLSQKPKYEDALGALINYFFDLINESNLKSMLNDRFEEFKNRSNKNQLGVIYIDIIDEYITNQFDQLKYTLAFHALMSFDYCKDLKSNLPLQPITSKARDQEANYFVSIFRYLEKLRQNGIYISYSRFLHKSLDSSIDRKQSSRDLQAEVSYAKYDPNKDMVDSDLIDLALLGCSDRSKPVICLCKDSSPRITTRVKIFQDEYNRLVNNPNYIRGQILIIDHKGVNDVFICL